MVTVVGDEGWCKGGGEGGGRGRANRRHMLTVLINDVRWFTALLQKPLHRATCTRFKVRLRI